MIQNQVNPISSNLPAWLCFLFLFILGMLVRVNEKDMTKEFENSSFVFLNQNMSVQWENQTLSASFLQTCEYNYIIDLFNHCELNLKQKTRLWISTCNYKILNWLFCCSKRCLF